MKVVIPLAGKDDTFESRGMTKALFPVMGRPFIEVIAESRPYPFSEAIFILHMDDDKKYNIGKRLKEIFGPKITIVWTDEMTEGAPCSVLLAKDMINTEEDVVIDLADQYLDLTGFMDAVEKTDAHGIIPVFQSNYWKVGYAAIDEGGHVTKVVEKEDPPISTHSTACISYFRHGRDFVKYAEQMVGKNRRIKYNNRFYVSIVYNEMIEDMKKIRTAPCELVCPLGSMEGISVFEQMRRPLKWKS